MSERFPFLPLVNEGGPMHPELVFECSDDKYAALLLSYGKVYGAEELKSIAVSRPHILDKVLKENFS